jgi:ATP-dependent DNA helicase RecG
VPTVTTLSRIEPHRLRALILEDLARYPGSASSQINARVGPELSGKTVKRAIDELVAAGEVAYSGEKRWRRYRLAGQHLTEPMSKGQTSAECKHSVNP